MSSTAVREAVDQLDIPREKLPRHVAIIMDGNGRWAQNQGLPRIEGHRRGVSSVRVASEFAARLKLEQLTLYCFSSENWKRPQQELDFLMHLLEQYLVEERGLLKDNNIRLSVIGRLHELGEPVRHEIQKTVDFCRENTGLHLCLAINYGGRDELVDATRKLAERVQAGELAPSEITAQSIADSLYTAGMPDPDLLIRTAGELRISNFLLWQISYSEIWITTRFWPEFSPEEFTLALRDYAARQRRFGGLT